MGIKGEWKFVQPQIGGTNLEQFNGIELNDDFGLNWNMAFYRSYDPSIGRWGQVDPLAEKYLNMSSYNGMGNNPITSIDPKGDSVIIEYNKSKNTLSIVDYDHYSSDLPTSDVNYNDYQESGARNSAGELIYNQRLIVENVFSGGSYNSSTDVFSTNGTDEEKEIPNGSYDVLDNLGTNHSGWLRLDPVDSDRYDDQVDSDDENNGRDGFRLHLGRISHGCVTILKGVDVEGNIVDRTKEYFVIKNILRTTSSEQVNDRRGMQYLNPYSERTRYGNLKVSGNIPDNSSIKIK